LIVPFGIRWNSEAALTTLLNIRRGSAAPSRRMASGRIRSSLSSRTSLGRRRTSHGPEPMSIQ
jgi:hypothetical protein